MQTKTCNVQLSQNHGHFREVCESGTFQQFVEADNNLAEAEDLSDESIIRMVQEGEQGEDRDTDVSDSRDGTPPITSYEVMTVLGKVHNHIQLWPSDEKALDHVSRLEEAVLTNGIDTALKQTTIENYFTSGLKTN